MASSDMTRKKQCLVSIPNAFDAFVVHYERAYTGS